MIDLAFVKRLIETVESSDIDTLEISRWGTKIRISKNPAVIGGETVNLAALGGTSAGTNTAGSLTNSASNAPAAPVAATNAAVDTNLTEVVSPMVGTFYRAPAPDADPYVQIGDHVSKGQTLCILEAMKLMNELEAETDGTIKEVCVDNTEPVEYGQILFRILPD